MSNARNYRLWIAGVVLILAGVALIVLGYQKLKPLPETTVFKTNYYTFSYPRMYAAKEYAPGVVSIGHSNGDGLDPLIEVNRYQSDPDSSVPKSFDIFIKQQAAALCGADGPVESITCTQVGVTPYMSPARLTGKKLDLVLVRKNLNTATSSNSTYGPVYVFDTSASSTPAALASTTDPFRYSAIFVYPSLTAFLNGTTSPQILDEVLSTFTLVK